ncbi:MAG: GAF domain-containing protein [Chloroflexi bacterium]|nr:GAF domain-containing protein [Chloroflexota bacterium]
MKTALTQTSANVQGELELWRSNVIAKTLAITSYTFFPAIVIWIIQFRPNKTASQVAYIYLFLYALILSLAIFRKINARIKAWGLIFLSYMVGTIALILGGLVGDGRIYFITVPILAMLLINTQAGVLMASFCLLTYFGISVTAHTGWLTNSLIMTDNSLLLSTWLQEGIVVTACLILILTLHRRHSELLMSLATEKVDLLDTVKESESRYRLISELVSDLAYVLRITPDGALKFEWTTEAFSQAIKSPSEELLHWQSLIHPPDMPIAREAIQRLFAGDTDEREFRVVMKNGEIRWVRNYARPEWDEVTNQVVRVFGAMQDITTRIESEKKIQLRNKKISRLYRASTTLIYKESLNPEHLAESIVKAILEEFGKSNCSLLVIEKFHLKRIAVAGSYSSEVSKGELTLDGKGLVPQAIRSGQIINASDVSKDTNYIPNWAEARSELVIPLKVGDTITGAIDMQSDKVDAFNKDDERLLSIFAERAASALENARLYKQTQEHLRRITALRHVDNAIAGSFDLRLILRVLLEEVMKQLEVDAADVLLYDNHMQRLECATRQGFKTDALQYTSLRLGEGYAGKAALKRRIVHVENIIKEDANLQNAPLLAKENFVSYYGVPLVAKGQLKGVLEIFHRKSLVSNSDWLEFLKTLAGQAAIAIDNATMFDNLQRSNSELLQAYDATLEGWVQALNMRDTETETHTQRVTKTILELARAMGISNERLVHIKRGALLHDIGKIAIPDNILLKPGSLTDSEWEIMRKHPVYARHFLSKIDYLHPALEIPYSHHEKWDGSGYPQGLKREEIPLSARIFAVVDVWDALGSDRPYRKALPQDKILAYIHEQKGTHFDPNVVEVFIDILSKNNHH